MKKKNRFFKSLRFRILIILVILGIVPSVIVTRMMIGNYENCLLYTSFKGYGSYDWGGLRNYIDLFQDVRVGKSYLFTFKFAIVATIIVNIFSLILALGLNSKIRAKSALRGIYFIPNVLGGLVVGYIFSFIFTYILPAVGKALGIDFLSSSMLADTKSAWFAIVIVAAWQAVSYTHLNGNIFL